MSTPVTIGIGNSAINMTMKRTRPRRCRFQRQEQLLGIEEASLVLPSIVGHRQVTSWFSTLILVLVVIIDITFSSLSSGPSSVDFIRTTPLFHHSAFFVVSAETADDDSLHHCPGPDEAFITTCSDGNSGGNSGGDENLMDNNDRHGIDDHDLDADKQTTLPEISLKDDDDDDGFDLVDEDLSEGIIKNDEDAYHQKEKAQTKFHYDSNDVTDNNIGHLNDGRKLHEQQQSKNDGTQSQEQQPQQQQSRSDGAQQQQQSLSGGTQSQQQQSSCCNTNASSSSTTTTTTSSEDNEYSVYHQLKKTTATFVHRHYNPLPQRGKCAIGSACGLLASRLSLGVANRIFRVAGATWVFSEAMHASGLCGNDDDDDDDDETSSCAIIPEEARPWIRILRRSIGQKVENIRTLARKLWNKERIRELARQDEALAFGLAAGAFIGFII